MGSEAVRGGEQQARYLAVLAAAVAVIGLVLMGAGDGVGASIGRVLALVAAPLAGLFAWRCIPDSGRRGGQGAGDGTASASPSASAAAMKKPPRTTKAGQSAGERWWFRLSVVAALGTAMLLFWSWTQGMNESSCRETPVQGVPLCDGKGPAARTLLGWALLVATLVAVGLVMRRSVRRRRLVRSGWNFVRTEGLRADQGRVLLRLAVVLCWSVAGVMLLALWAPDSAGGAFAIGGIVYAVLALVLLPAGRARVRP